MLFLCCFTAFYSWQEVNSCRVLHLGVCPSPPAVMTVVCSCLLTPPTLSPAGHLTHAVAAASPQDADRSGEGGAGPGSRRGAAGRPRLPRGTAGSGPEPARRWHPRRPGPSAEGGCLPQPPSPAAAAALLPARNRACAAAARGGAAAVRGSESGSGRRGERACRHGDRGGGAARGRRAAR